MATKSPSHLPIISSSVVREKPSRTARSPRSATGSTAANKAKRDAFPSDFSPEENGAVQQLVNLSSDSSDSEQSPVKKKQPTRTPSTPKITLGMAAVQKSAANAEEKQTEESLPPPAPASGVKMIGCYTPRARKKLLEKYMAKRKRVCLVSFHYGWDARNHTHIIVASIQENCSI